MKQFLNIILVSLFVSLLTSCSTRPYFAIENKSQKEVKLELVLDSLNPMDIVAQFINNRKYENRNTNDSVINHRHDSIKNTLTELDIATYFQDSLNLQSLFNSIPALRFEAFTRRMQIYPSNLSEDEYDSEKFNLNFNQTLSDYYINDSTLVNKIISEYTITLFLPSNYTYAKQCSATGDASCSVDNAFPEVKEMRIVIAKDNNIILTKDNFKHILKNKKVQHQPDSYVFEIE
jgi:hypothetical protein